MESQTSSLQQNKQSHSLISQSSGSSILAPKLSASNKTGNDTQNLQSESMAQQRGSHSPIQQAQTKRKPPLPSPFLSKHDGSHSKLALYSQAQVQQAQLQALGNIAQANDNSNKSLAYNLKNQHQISQGQIPTAQSNPSQLNSQQEEEFRQTWGKMKPRISKQLPAPFNAINNKTSKAKGKKGFMQFKNEIEAQQTENFYKDKLDSAVNAEEFKQMQNLLQPLNIEADRKDKMERALTKIEQYNTNNNGGNAMKNKKGSGLANLDPLTQIDGLSKFLQGTSEKQLLSQSSAFSTFDTYSIKSLQKQDNIKLDQMITLAVFKSTSGTVKKMLHAPSLRIFCIKEVPISSRDMRQMIKEWIAKWEHHCTTDQYVKVHSSFWNSPEGCVSVVTDYAGNGSLQNLVQSIGALPESILKHLAKQILRSLDYLHDQGMAHSNICCSQILFDRKGKVKIGPGFAHLLRIKSDNQSTLNQNSHNSLVTVLCENSENYKNKGNLIKEKFSTSGNISQQQNNNTEQDSVQLQELKKLDLFDLGILLIIAATGGLDVISEESISGIQNLSNSCCILHAVQGQNKSSQSIQLIRKILNRLSTQAQDFICKCMQQRFSMNEIKKEGKPAKIMSTSDMLTHPWILTEHEGGANAGGMGNKKKVSQISQMNIDSNNKNNNMTSSQRMRLTLKELLNVSSDWKDVNKKNPTNGNQTASGMIPMDFQSQQIERIVEAIALTLPSGGVSNNSIIGGIVGTLSTEQNSTSSVRYEDFCIRELAYDLGVDPRALKAKIQTIFNQTSSDNAQIDKINSLQFHL
ncbi:protein kinase domain containing protein [Stylonychia lemnae]|uniref:Protein kinase domain containing protein n=1 Tax=Stylonychia lemnae TaxID=5949 RepID=A0A077ZY11_STYLE|nr:protein kinase domain containing protein [Stylonychia lemnae]|eukprot:CDW74770.1 protein kinase domain containing protein [Stylonychia lemnae]